MMRKAHLRRSLVQFRTNPLRTSLALLGMVLGVSSVVGMVSIGEGAQKEILASLEALGGDVVHVKAKEVPDSEVAKVVNDSTGLNRNDLIAVRNVLEGVAESGYVQWAPLGVSDVPMETYNLELAAASPSIFSVHRLGVSAGRALVSMDDDHARRVAVVGEEIARTAYKGEAVGKRLRIGYAYFEIVGVLEKKRSGGADMPVDPERYNRAVVVPFNTATEAITPAAAYSEIDVLSLRVQSLEDTLRAKRAITPVLRSLHGGKDDFEIVAPEEILERRRGTQAVLNAVLIAIAAISLLVGGIGVMNIMLANIMERISEIGLRRAIGASREDVRDQFLIEAVLVCAVGGGIGILVGFGVSFGVGALFDLPAAFAWEAMLAAFGLSMVVGLIFGIWPAVRASRIHPVEALQHE